MPASVRAHVSRKTASSSRPYDRRSPAANPKQSIDALIHPHLSPPASPIQQDPEPNPDTIVIPPDHPGLPTYTTYKRIEAKYLHGLSPRKRDKALITQAMFDKIWDVLHQPDACTIETPQFRFWVRKMFSLSRPIWVGVRGDGSWREVRVGETVDAGIADMDSDADEDETTLELGQAMEIQEATTDLFSAVVLHEDRPVAIMEQLYDLFCYCHVRAGHGGRDKTCAVIRQHYSWVPKELTAQFVKACPTCALKRSGYGPGVLVQGRVLGSRAYERSLGAGEMSLPVAPSFLGSVGWPTTGGPLDPEPYGRDDDSPGGPCLPSVLRPLRLPGPIASDLSPSSSSSPPPPPSECVYPLQIDPILLSLDYSGMNMKFGPEFSSAGVAEMSFGGADGDVMPDAAPGPPVGDSSANMCTTPQLGSLRHRRRRYP